MLINLLNLAICYLGRIFPALCFGDAFASVVTTSSVSSVIVLSPYNPTLKANIPELLKCTVRIFMFPKMKLFAEVEQNSGIFFSLFELNLQITVVANCVDPLCHVTCTPPPAPASLVRASTALILILG